MHNYLEDESIVVDNDTAVKLGCLELRRFYKDMPQIALKKRENFTMLEYVTYMYLYIFVPSSPSIQVLL